MLNSPFKRPLHIYIYIMKMKIIIHLSNFNCHFHVQVNCNSYVDVSGQPHLVSVILVLCLPTCNILSSAQSESEIAILFLWHGARLPPTDTALKRVVKILPAWRGRAKNKNFEKNIFVNILIWPVRNWLERMNVSERIISQKIKTSGWTHN